MKKRMLLSLIALMVLACTFGLGYIVGNQSRGSEDPSSFNQAIRSKWVKEEQPPLPAISINGTAIEVARGGYSWCPSPGSCVSVDASIPELKAAIVPAGSVIDTTAPQGIKEFTLTNTSKDFSGDSYIVPETKGQYLYNIHCEWFLDQGQADYYFLVEVQ